MKRDIKKCSDKVERLGRRNRERKWSQKIKRKSGQKVERRLSEKVNIPVKREDKERIGVRKYSKSGIRK